MTDHLKKSHFLNELIFSRQNSNYGGHNLGNKTQSSFLHLFNFFEKCICMSLGTISEKGFVRKNSRFSVVSREEIFEFFKFKCLGIHGGCKEKIYSRDVDPFTKHMKAFLKHVPYFNRDWTKCYINPGLIRWIPSALRECTLQKCTVLEFVVTWRYHVLFRANTFSSSVIS